MVVCAVAACGGGSESRDDGAGLGGDTTASDPARAAQPTPTGKATPAPPPGSPSSDSGVASDGSAEASADASTASDPNVIANASCKAPRPSGAPAALPLPIYAGACPAIAAPPSFTTITSSGAQRTFLVFRPAAIAAGEKLPVVFLFHWLGGSPEDMASRLEVQAAVDARRFIGVIPAPKGDVLFRWPFEASQSQGRVDEEARFFDDMLACVGAALPADKECVSSVGVSAGALWTGQLASLRSGRLASMVSLSGGVGGIVRGWTSSPHRVPALVLWGGANDTYPSGVPIMNFQSASKSLLGSLGADGHYIVECTHNCGHTVPPFDVPAAGSGGFVFDPVWRFVLDHPYWLPPSKSPYGGKPLPPAYPAWCGQGAGGAIPRASSAACP